MLSIIVVAMVVLGASARGLRGAESLTTPSVRLFLQNATKSTAESTTKSNLMRLYIAGDAENEAGAAAETKISWQNISNVYTLVIEPQQEQPVFMFKVDLTNHLETAALVHWHGLTPPTTEDGVPGVSSMPLAPNASTFYSFQLSERGLFWMHSHWAWQNAEGLSAPILIRDAPSSMAGDAPPPRDVMLMLQDQHVRQPCEFDALVYPEWCAGDPLRHGRVATGNTNKNYTFLANKRPAHDPWVETVAAGTSVRLRVLHAGTMNTFEVQLAPELDAAVVATDGYDTEPLPLPRRPCAHLASASAAASTADTTDDTTDTSAVAQCGTFPIAQAQRTDLLLALPADLPAGYYPVLARRNSASSVAGAGSAQVGILLRVVPPADQAADKAADKADAAVNGKARGGGAARADADPLAGIAPPTIAAATRAGAEQAAWATSAFDKQLRATGSDALAGALPAAGLGGRAPDREMVMELTGTYTYFPDFGINGRKWFLLQEHAFVNTSAAAAAGGDDPSLVDGVVVDIDPEGLPPAGAREDWYTGRAGEAVPPLGPPRDARLRYGR